MEKIDNAFYNEADSDELISKLIDNQNHIMDWIKEHEKYVEPLEKAWKEAIEQTLKAAKEKGA